MSAEHAPDAAPWSADDFDADRAWQLVLALRAERDAARLDAERAERQAAQAVQSGEALTAARAEVASLRRQLAVERSSARHGLAADDLDLFTRHLADEDEIAEVAARFGPPRSPVAAPAFIAPPPS